MELEASRWQCDSLGINIRPSSLLIARARIDRKGRRTCALGISNPHSHMFAPRLSSHRRHGQG